MNHSPQVTKFAGLGLLAIAGMIVALIVWSNSDISQDSQGPATTLSSTFADHSASLPGRQTATPSHVTPRVLPTVPLTPQVTSHFNFPTSPPTIASTPSLACTGIFPLDSVESIEFGVTTITQLEASFGRATYQSGRAPRFRFEEGDCVLIVTVGVDEALEAELPYYGTLDLLLDRYGAPAAVGISQGNLTLLNLGNAVLLYPAEGLIAIFDIGPNDLTLASPVASLQFRPPYATETQVRRLNLRPIDHWIPPESPLPLQR